MKIKYLGHSSFKITGKTPFGEEVTLITDPFNSKEVGIPYSKQEADIVTVSHQHGDHNAIENIEGEPRENYILLDTPGEYEIKGLRIFGLKSFHDDKQGKERGSNVIFVFDFMEARIAHLGDLGHKLESDQLEQLENIDILLTPVGGDFTIGPKEALVTMEDLEPAVTIPMHYKSAKHSATFDKVATLEDFLKEVGAADTETVKELSVKNHNDLEQMPNVIALSF
jgi:L-ascorbate metabolism protein UlaG (beta-lactamase superfamily)